MTVIERFVTNLSAAFARRLPADTIAMYVEKLEKYQARLNLREDQWSAMASRLIADCDKFPLLNQIYACIMAERSKAGKLIPVFRTWTDNDAKLWAQKTGAMRSEMVDQWTLDEWKQEAVTGDEARDAFRQGWIESGADPAKCDSMFQAIDHAIKKPSDKRGTGFTHIGEIVPEVEKTIAQQQFVEYETDEEDEVPF